ncbi:MAG TPA: 4-(cytidine 5'-diphospho)-2-C-methyl-D-erythritol kinase [Chromatiaceae bacterium]|nr:4-(cytidine 5'-diphospho)-2-C-methyl-D-erythritol kinase [Chromatiaceae bacterium]
MISAPWPAPAKLNLTLRVLGRREDGYHRLQTLFQFIDYCDWLAFTPRADGQIRLLTEIPGVAAASHLSVRAARQLQAATDCTLGVDLSLDKRLPLGGGLGGGSSDAATTLVALNRIWGTGLSEDELAALGLALGADVPVFVRGRAAWGEGVGEHLTPVEVPEPWYLVMAPACVVSTADVFADPELTRNSPSIKIADFLAGDDRNDCQDLVRLRYPAVADALDWLGTFSRGRLTGTGACVFAAFGSADEAQAVLHQAPAGLRGYVAKGLNRSPLLHRLAAS